MAAVHVTDKLKIIKS